MPKFSANLSFLFAEHAFLERFSAARRAGFAAVEFHFPYAHDSAVLAEVMQTADVEVVLFNLPAGNWDAGERGIACHPQRRAEFQEGVAQAIDYAHALDCPRLNCLVGIPPAGVSPQLARETLIENLRFAAAACGKAGIQLLIEPLNTRDTPGFLISTTRAALQLIAAVGADQLKLQYDVYHAQVMEGDLAHTLEAHLPLIGHIQIADNPGRHEPGTGEINFPFLFRHLDAIGYTGWVGCEYKPRGATMDSLGWRAPA
jgi:hydroxypyruvate isomerase